MPRRQVAGGGTLNAKLLMPERQVPANTGLRYPRVALRYTGALFAFAL
ncbi:MAG: hypothetical protein ACRC2T_07050 [Thermoguttaceae bacterium]